MMCLLCDRRLPDIPSWRGLFLNDLPETACRSCKDRFERITGSACSHCGRQGEAQCADCRRWESSGFAGAVTGGKSLYAYNEAMQEYINQFKFLQDIALAQVFAPDIHLALKRTGAAIVPIPLHPSRLESRTFPQVGALLDAAGIRHVQFLEKANRLQGQKTKEERLSATRLFTWNGQPVPPKIVLVDDVYTTGTTMHHAARTLREAGAKEVHLLSLARG